MFSLFKNGTKQGFGNKERKRQEREQNNKILFFDIQWGSLALTLQYLRYRPFNTLHLKKYRKYKKENKKMFS